MSSSTPDPTGDAAAHPSAPRWGPVVATLAVLGVSNVVSNRVVAGWGYVAWNVAVAAGLVAVAARLDRLSWTELGLSRATVARGLRWAGVLAGLVAAAYALAVAVPDLRDLFRDRRVGAVSVPRMLAEVTIRIPFGTVLLEEVAFRGVLLAQLRRRIGPVRALAASSFAFGLWHVLPAWKVNTVNPAVIGTGIGRVPAVIGAVVATTLAGLPMGWARLRARSLLAPVGLHVATNSFGYALAWLVLRS